jgi:molecular chaperone DnaK (HSP70)
LKFNIIFFVFQDLFRATTKPVQKVLEDADMKKDEIDEIVLVGGSTRIPKIQQLVKDYITVGFIGGETGVPRENHRPVTSY